LKEVALARADHPAPGAPGQRSTWNPGSKTGVGAGFGNANPVWFTLGRGGIEECYYPRVDHPVIRGCRFAVTDGDCFISFEYDDTTSQVTAIDPGVPAYRIVNRHPTGRYVLEKEIIVHPIRPAILQQVRFHGQGLELYAMLHPNLAANASAWIGDHNGVPMLFASGKMAVALACSQPWLKRSAGFVGESDGENDLRKHSSLRNEFTRAAHGNVSLTGQIDCIDGEPFLLVLAFGLDAEEAGFNAQAALLDGFDRPATRYADEWRRRSVAPLLLDGSLLTTSIMVMRVHEAKQPPGACVASLAIPFGQARTGNETGGYHLVWARDVVEANGGLLAAGIRDAAGPALRFLQSTQNPDGHWPQNTDVSGKPFWSGIEMDETALAILLIDLSRRETAITTDEIERFWPMMRRAAEYLTNHGPTTPEDRWEKNGGYSPFTMAAEIAALLVAAEHAAEQGEDRLANEWRATADRWNADIDPRCYVTDTPLSRKLGIDGYYIRLGSGGRGGQPMPDSEMHDRGSDSSVSPDALALVRFGLRSANHPRILNTVRAIDAALTVDLGYGPGWRRYLGDKYGEYPDGQPFDHKGGVGRAWPLFSGERGHYEVAAGRPDEARRMARLMESTATPTGLIAEQVWDADPIPEKGLCRGRPTTSACPLVWAHAEYVKLLRSIRDRVPFDRPRQAVQRYLK
jgi:glucoamylase